jgi:hypothetical protein
MVSCLLGCTFAAAVVLVWTNSLPAQRFSPDSATKLATGHDVFSATRADKGSWWSTELIRGRDWAVELRGLYSGVHQRPNLPMPEFNHLCLRPNSVF